MPRVKNTDASGEKHVALSRMHKCWTNFVSHHSLSNFAPADYDIINNSLEGRSIIDKFLQQCLGSIRLNPNPPLLQMAMCNNQTHASLLLGTRLRHYLTHHLFLQLVILYYRPSHVSVYSQMERHAISSEKMQSGWRQTCRNFTPLCRRWPGRPSPIFVRGALEFFSEISSARHHIKTTLDRGHCGKPRGSCTVGTVNPPSSLVCPTCSILFPFLSALLECIRSHFSHVARTDPAPEVAPTQKCIHERVGPWCSASEQK